jgi:hypothetical protein
VTVEGPKLAADIAQIEDPVDPSKQVIGRNMIFEAEIVKELALIRCQPTHHRTVLLQITRKTESQLHSTIKNHFINSIGENLP